MRTSLVEKLIDQYQGKDVEFTSSELEQRDRIMYTLEIYIQHLTWTDTKIYSEIKLKYDITFQQCCKDVSMCERIISNEKSPTGDPQKVFARYLITQVAKKAISIAEEKQDAYGMSFGANIIGKYHLADKEDVERPPYDKIVSPLLQITNDPTILPNYKPIPKGLREKMEREFGIYEKNKIKDAVIVENGTDE